jgi:xanthine dehydrogenase YagR molybdenum-binding subunit
MIGEPLDRLDGPLKVTGGARYSAEWPIEHIAHGVIVQSTVAKGTIVSMDTAEAERLPGVLRVLTPFNAPRLPLGGNAGLQANGRALSLLQNSAVRYNGEPIGLVLAETFEDATFAASRIQVSYRSEPPALDMERELARAEQYTKPILGQPPSTLRGDPDVAFPVADVVIDETYTTPLETHNALEPHATIAEWDADRLTLYDSSQYVYGVKRVVAKAIGLDESQVRVVTKFVGGAFGSKGSAWSHVVLAAMAAQTINRPVKIVLTRRQMFGLVGARPHTVQRLTVGARRDGAVTAIRQEVTTSTSTFEDWVEPSTMQTRMLYDVPNVETAQWLVRLNLGTPTFNRGPGESSGTFGLESALDEVAAKLSIDPIALRLKNYAERDPETGRPWSSKALRECYAKGAELIGWSGRTPAPRSMRSDGKLLGLGMSTATYATRRQPASAVARLLPDGTIEIGAATHELGTGTYTVMTQLAAEACGVPFARVRFKLGDTNLPENPISAGSMTAASTGSAVNAAALALRAKLESLGLRVDDVADCRAAVEQNGGQPIEANAHEAPSPEAQGYAMNAFGAVFVRVLVDPDLHTIRVDHVAGAYGIGRVLNEKTARSQAIGGIVYGLSMALTEDTVVDRRSGRYLNADLAEYLVPVNADVPDIDVFFADERDEHVNPIGVKGLGEIGTTGVAAAVANAVYHATGVRVRSLPLTLDKLMIELTSS